jgi:hypothetical protein
VFIAPNLKYEQANEIYLATFFRKSIEITEREVFLEIANFFFVCTCKTREQATLLNDEKAQLTLVLNLLLVG